MYIYLLINVWGTYVLYFKILKVHIESLDIYTKKLLYFLIILVDQLFLLRICIPKRLAETTV